MFENLMYVLLYMALVLGSVKLTKTLLKKYKLNRWVIGFTAPFVIIIPLSLFREIHPIIWYLLMAIFSIMCMMFFEITRTKLENNTLKGIIRYQDKK